MQISRSKLNQKRYNGIEEKRIDKHQGLSKLRRIKQSRDSAGRLASKDDSRTAEMMMEMKRIFDDKLQTLEKDNNALKQKVGRSEQSKTEKNSISQSRKTKEESEIKMVESSNKSLESSVASSSKTVNSSMKNNRQKERSNPKRKEKETKKSS